MPSDFSGWQKEENAKMQELSEELSDYVPVNVKIAQEQDTKDRVVKSVDYVPFFGWQKKCLQEWKS